MISLITISCITAAFTPVITKKFKNGNISVAMSELTTKCQTKFTEKCSLCYSQKCVVCSRTCGEYQHINTTTCLCENCLDKDPNCIKCDVKYCLRCREGYGYDSATHSCTLCSAGTYSTGTEPCKKCPKGQYQSQSGKLGYKTCPNGKWSNAGSSSCNLNCEAGYKCATGTKNN